MESSEIEHLQTKYKDRMLMLAFVVSQWSPAQGGGHGCVITFKGKYVISTGFTGPDRNAQAPCETAGPDVHAEVNAVLNLEKIGIRHPGRMVAYITKKPCEECFKALARAGVVAMFWLQSCNGADCFWTKAQGRKLNGYGVSREEVADHVGDTKRVDGAGTTVVFRTRGFRSKARVPRR